jgi:hypothetical protein
VSGRWCQGGGVRAVVSGRRCQGDGVGRLHRAKAKKGMGKEGVGSILGQAVDFGAGGSILGH